MRLLRLEIQTLPGIEPGFAVEDIDAGVNLVTGPNAIGKSSLVRALRYLVGGVQSGDPRAVAVSAVFADADGGQWQARRTGTQLEWTREGRATEPPRLPGRDQLHCYWLSMEDLLDADDPDRALVEELRTALAGGYNLAALREAPGLRVGPKIGQAEARRVQSADRSLRDVEADYAALRRDEDGLPELERRIETARRARDLAARLDQALSLLDVRSNRREAEVAVAAFPAQMAQLRGDELQRLDRFAARRRELNAALETARTRRADAEALLRDTGLESERPAGDALEAERGRLERARSNRDRLADRRGQLEQDEAAEAQALAALGGSSAPPDLSPEQISEAGTLARQIHGRETEANEIAARIEAAPEAPSEQSLLSHAGAVEALTAWLSAAGQKRPPAAALWLAALGALVAAGAGSWPMLESLFAGELDALAAALNNGFSRVWVAVAGGVLGIAGVVWVALHRDDTEVETARTRFAETGLEPPAEWTRAAVQARLEELASARAALYRDQSQAQYAEAQQRQLDRVREALAALESRRRALAERLGFNPALTAQGLDHFVRLVSEYQQAAARRRATAAKVARLQAEVDDAGARVGRLLAQWRVDADDSIEGLTAALAGLAERSRRAEGAEDDVRHHAREAEQLAESLRALESEEADLYREVGLEPGARRELEALCERLEAWRERQRALETARIREEQRREALAGAEDLLARVEEEDREGLERERERAVADAAALETLRDQRTAIRTRLDVAGRDQQLERTLADRDAALDALQDRYEEQLFAEAGWFLLDTVECEHRSEHEPAVLRDARDRLQRFTHHDWDLELDDDQGFMARDLRRNERRTLAELSSGTRMQLLLAVRLAWTRRIEQGGTALPLFLDEALTTADEQRFDAVARSLATLAADEDRQVFYLSARQHELALWERATGQRPHHVDLAAVRFGQGAKAAALRLPEPRRLPPPGDQAPEAYAERLGVPPVEPRRDPGELHLFHLLRDDLTLLHRLMEDWRINTLAQLESLLAS
ncbi:hypothetical protein H0Z60_10635, partial [Ectothiorhodospiraceae bacterium WFHF3C12]|nr:hypothetical protein [Ectothiorhodospiraceae bacterium WFHF3C12]